MVSIPNGESSDADFGLHDAFLMERNDASFVHFLRFVATRRIEEDCNVYEALAVTALDGEIRKFFLAMADFKAEQAARIREFEENGKDLGDRDALPPISPARTERESAGSFEDACRMAFRFELESYRLYIHLAELEEDVIAKKLFLLLTQLHKSNLHYIENRVHAVSAVRKDSA